MLDEFDKELEHTDTRLRALTSRVQTAIRKSGGVCCVRVYVFTNKGLHIFNMYMYMYTLTVT